MDCSPLRQEKAEARCGRRPRPPVSYGGVRSDLRPKIFDCPMRGEDKRLAWAVGRAHPIARRKRQRKPLKPGDFPEPVIRALALAKLQIGGEFLIAHLQKRIGVELRRAASPRT